MTDILTILKEDYRRFPKDQTYDIYADDVYFKDPLNEFRGCDRYRQMIQFMERWFAAPALDLHDIHQTGQDIRTDWTLSWTTPLPWRPGISIKGWSELRLNDEGLISAHIDYWHCSIVDVLKQHVIVR
ncbi:MAG: DUF2358 domain-containing protein [Cyanobacteria bacterium P01_E01_bin.6]